VRRLFILLGRSYVRQPSFLVGAKANVILSGDRQRHLVRSENVRVPIVYRVVLPEADLADVVATTGRLRQGEVPAADTRPAHAASVTAPQERRLGQCSGVFPEG
jgi:hypothetical protein